MKEMRPGPFWVLAGLLALVVTLSIGVGLPDVGLLQAHFQCAAGFLHGVIGVRGQIDDHLVNLGGVSQNRAAVFVHGFLDIDGRRNGGTDQLEDFFHNRLHFQGAELLFALPAEGQNLLDEVFGPQAGLDAVDQQHSIAMGQDVFGVQIQRVHRGPGFVEKKRLKRRRLFNIILSSHTVC